jgi:hypothetical protein
VSVALTELGLRVIEGPHPRADLIARDDARGLLVIEAKGLDGCAREANLRQAERWVAEVRYTCTASQEEINADAEIKRYAEKLTALGVSLPADQNINIKGMMVIGTYRRTPLDKRTEPDFPDPVLRAVSRAGVCGLTGLQLLLIVLQIRKDPSLKAQFIEQMFATNGHCDQQVSWEALLVRRPVEFYGAALSTGMWALLEKWSVVCFTAGPTPRLSMRSRADRTAGP